MENETVQTTTPKKFPVIVKLSEPIEWGSDTIAEIRLNKPKGKHVRGLTKDMPLGHLLDVASKLSGHSSKVFDELSSSDAMEVARAVGELL